TDLLCSFFFFSSRRRHTRFSRDWSSDVCSSDLSRSRGAQPSDLEGFVPGTLSLESVHHHHARAADILVDPAWSDAVNEYGYAGRSEERRVGKEGRARWWRDTEKKEGQSRRSWAW